MPGTQQPKAMLLPLLDEQGISSGEHLNATITSLLLLIRYRSVQWGAQPGLSVSV
jgi:hypothetical protein